MISPDPFQDTAEFFDAALGFYFEWSILQDPVLSPKTGQHIDLNYQCIWDTKKGPFIKSSVHFTITSSPFDCNRPPPEPKLNEIMGGDFWKRGFFGKILSGRRRRLKKHPFYQMFRRYWGRVNPDFAPLTWRLGAFAPLPPPEKWLCPYHWKNFVGRRCLFSKNLKLKFSWFEMQTIFKVPPAGFLTVKMPIRGVISN